MTERTDRTIENRNGMSEFLLLVTLFTLGTSFLVIHFLNVHAENTTLSLSELSNQENGTIADDLMTRVTDTVSFIQSTVFLNMLMHSLLHFMTRRLDKHEEELPRIVDLHAAASKPKLE